MSLLPHLVGCNGGNVSWIHSACQVHAPNAMKTNSVGNNCIGTILTLILTLVNGIPGTNIRKYLQNYF